MFVGRVQILVHRRVHVLCLSLATLLVIDVFFGNDSLPLVQEHVFVVLFVVEIGRSNVGVIILIEVVVRVQIVVQVLEVTLLLVVVDVGGEARIRIVACVQRVILRVHCLLLVLLLPMKVAWRFWHVVVHLLVAVPARHYLVV